jgi:hypothetical protein
VPSLCLVSDYITAPARARFSTTRAAFDTTSCPSPHRKYITNLLSLAADLPNTPHIDALAAPPWKLDFAAPTFYGNHKTRHREEHKVGWNVTCDQPTCTLTPASPYHRCRPSPSSPHPHPIRPALALGLLLSQGPLGLCLVSTVCGSGASTWPRRHVVVVVVVVVRQPHPRHNDLTLTLTPSPSLSTSIAPSSPSQARACARSAALAGATRPCA